MDTPDIFADQFAALTPDERQEVRAMITHPLYVKALRIVANKKPSVFSAGCHGTGVDEHTPIRAAMKLAELRGWELYEKALFLLLKDPEVIRQEPEANYPDSGRLDLETPAPIKEESAKKVRVRKAR